MNKDAIKSIILAGGTVQYGKIHICMIRTQITTRFQVESYYETKSNTFKNNDGFGFKSLYDYAEDAVDKFILLVKMAKSGQVR